MTIFVQIPKNILTCGYGAKYQGLMRCLPNSIISTFFIRVTTSSWCVTMLPDWRGVAVIVSCEASSVSIDNCGALAVAETANGVVAAAGVDGSGWDCGGNCGDDMDALNLCVWGACGVEIVDWRVLVLVCSNCCCWELVWLKGGLWFGVDGCEGVDGANINTIEIKIINLHGILSKQLKQIIKGSYNASNRNIKKEESRKHYILFVFC